MSKAMRFGALVLCILLLGGMTAAHAEMVTVGITLTGLIPDGNGFGTRQNGMRRLLREHCSGGRKTRQPSGREFSHEQPF